MYAENSVTALFDFFFRKFDTVLETAYFLGSPIRSPLSSFSLTFDLTSLIFIFHPFLSFS